MSKQKTPSPLKVYFVYDRFESIGVAVVAENASRAKAVAWPDEWFQMNDYDYIDMRVELKPNAHTEGLTKEKVLSLEEGLERGGYSFVQVPCVDCGAEESEVVEDGVFYCKECWDKGIEDEVIK